MGISNKSVAVVLPASDVTVSELRVTAATLLQFADYALVVTNRDDIDSEVDYSSLLMNSRIDEIKIPYRLGKAEAVRTGLAIVLDRCSPDVVLQVDGHGKQPANSLLRLCGIVAKDVADLSVYDRYSNQDLTTQAHRGAISSLFSVILQRITGYRVRDAVCGTRAFSSSLGLYFLRNSRSYGYGLELEEFCLAAQTRARTLSVPVESNTQAAGTNVEKIIESFVVAAGYSQNDQHIRHECSYAVCQLKLRRDFQIAIAPRVWSFEYVGDIDGARDAYATSVRVVVDQ